MSRYDRIPPKPTTLGGVQFRSRLEAKWGACWLECGIGEYVFYEARTYQLAPGWLYTPDFFIGHGVFEIKPELPTEQEVRKAQALVSAGHVAHDNFRFLIGKPCDVRVYSYGLADVPHIHAWRLGGDKELRAVLNADGEFCTAAGTLPRGHRLDVRLRQEAACL